ncbi:MAG TPA: hypothetical protein DIV86_05245 [Alphaproteobacteria bacterium]|nr:hypothetical protein [Alphaproteobacteria bacterium]
MRDIYIEIFTNSFLAHFIFTFGSDFAYEFAVHYGIKPLYITMFSLLGSICGLTASYYIFYLAGTLLKGVFENSHSFRPFKHYYSKFKYYSCAVVAFPYLSVIAPFFCGLLRLDAKYIFPLFLFYRVAYYFYFLIFG